MLIYDQTEKHAVCACFLEKIPRSVHFSCIRHKKGEHDDDVVDTTTYTQEKDCYIVQTTIPRIFQTGYDWQASNHLSQTGRIYASVAGTPLNRIE